MVEDGGQKSLKALISGTQTYKGELWFPISDSCGHECCFTDYYQIWQTPALGTTLGGGKTEVYSTGLKMTEEIIEVSRAA